MDIDKETKDLTEKILHEIAVDIIERFDQKELKNDIGLLSGKAGISLFMFYNARYFHNERYETYAQKLLEDTFNDINNGSLLPTYCSGIAGVCWTIIHLVEEGFIEKENLEVLNDFDEFLYKAMQNFIESDNYDFLHGATGVAFYFTKRIKSNHKTKEYLEYYVQKLKDYAIFDEENKTAKIISTVLDENEKPKKVYNLSMSHGMSSIIIVLCKIGEIIIEKQICQKLIEGFSNYIISKEMKINPLTFSRYPSWVELNSNLQNSYSRLSWCYGDLGNGFAFLSAYKSLNNENYFIKAKVIFESLYLKKDISKQSIKDAGLCHGSAGISVICRNLNLFNNNLFKELDNYWKVVTLNFYDIKKDLNGFNMFTKDGLKFEVGILNGTAGVGLSFLSNISDNKLNWVEMLLIK